MPENEQVCCSSAHLIHVGAGVGVGDGVGVGVGVGEGVGSGVGVGAGLVVAYSQILSAPGSGSPKTLLLQLMEPVAVRVTNVPFSP
ncbi:hypothetical protein EGT07_04805 [Herbaspirillum sp. HC18]|nr:hypothetical protein EGT07_04805 [Herbaspirillum sp. HC18]